MSRQTKRAANLGFAAITVEGGLISPEQLSGIASATPDQKLAAEYGCPKGTNLRDEITRYFRIAQAHWQGYGRLATPTTAQTEAFVKSLLEQAFGFQLTGPHTHTQSDRRFQIAWEGKQGRVPVVVAAPITAEKGKLGEGFTRAQVEFGDGPGGRIPKRSPAVLLQDWLNANEASQWGLVFAGDRLRLMRDNASLTRPAYIEADLGAILRDEMFSDFTLLWLLIHASRFGAEGAPASESALERWREAGMKAGTAARERLRGNVEDALLSLGQGLLDANPQLRQRLDDQSLPMPQLFEQLLRVIYRLIFLAVAEDRDLLHPKGTTRATAQLYAENYSFAYLRDRSLRRNAHDHHLDAWEGLKIVFNALANGAPLLGLPALGGLFDAGLMPDLDGAQLPNRAMMAAIYKLGWLDNAGSRVRINWRDMATEELGSVYEGLLELVAVREEGGRKFSFAGGAEARGNARKTSGSYYTPDSLVQCLLDSALSPVLERAEADGGVASILDLNVIDPACGSGHFLLGAARRMATRVAQLRDPDAPDYNAAMRDVVRNCIHGVDRNPMAIELAKVALWIETVEPGKPLGFLDANLQCGDSLLGIFDLKALEEGIPDDAYKPLTDDDKETAKHFANRNKVEKVGQGMLDFGAGGSVMPPLRLAGQMDELRHLPEDTVAEVEAKRQKFDAWLNAPTRYATKVACDLYIAAFLMPKVGRIPSSAGTAMIPTTAHVRERLRGGQIHSRLEAEAVNVAEAALAFHWPLAFPEVIVSRGGFDVVLGNPPWERIKLQEQEFFAARDSEIARAPKAERERLLKELHRAAAGTPAAKLCQDFKIAKRVAEASSVVFTSPKEEDPTKMDPAKISKARRFPWTGRGDINTYALFAEHIMNLMREKGRAGLVAPLGIATNETLSPFFGYILSQKKLVSLFSMSEIKAWFAGTKDNQSFCLVTLGHSEISEFVFRVDQITELYDSRRRFTLSPESLSKINPNTKTAAIFRARADAELTSQIHERIPILLKEEAGVEANKWGISFLRMFDMSGDGELFRTAGQLIAEGFSRSGSNWLHADGARYVPLYEAKMVHQFDHRWGYYPDGATDDTRALPRPSIEEKNDANYEVSPRYWLDKEHVDARLKQSNWNNEWLIGWRDITNVTNERTLIAAIVPRVAFGDKFLIMQPEAHIRKIVALYGNLSSITLDYIARQKLGGTSLKYHFMKQFPILPPDAYSDADLNFIVPRVLELSYTSHAMAPLALDLGYEGPPFTWNEGRRAELRAELDAWYAHAYGLNRDELRYILAPKDVMGTDYPSETFRVLQEREERELGEYRTRRLVLAAYEKLIAEGMRPRTEGYS